MEFVLNLEHLLKFTIQSFDEKISDPLFRIPPVFQSKPELTDDELLGSRTGKILSSVQRLLHILENCYEPKLIALIEYIFHQSVSLINYGLSNNLLSTLPLCDIMNNIKAVVDISISHPSPKMTRTLVDFHKLNLAEIRLKHNKDLERFSQVEQEIILRLRFALVLYESLTRKEIVSNVYCHYFDELVKNLNVNEECDLFAELITSNSELIAAFTLTSVIPKYINASGSNTILMSIGNVISDLLVENSFEYLRIMFILSYLSYLYFTTENKLLVFHILRDANYWKFLQNGLIHIDPAVRKQSLYIMKISLSFLKENSILLNNLFNEKEKILVNKNISIDIDIRDFDEHYNAFQEFFIIIEYLEEKQVHILKPIFCVINTFLEKSVKILDVSWVVIIVRRMLSHDNMKVIKNGLSNLLKIPLSAYHDTSSMKSVIKLLVESLNSTQLYTTDWSTTLNELQSFFNLCCNEKSGIEFFRFLIREICLCQWSPEALFFVTRGLQHIRIKNCWQRDEMKLIKKLVTSGTVNHYTYIKSEVHCEILLVAIKLIDTALVSLDDVHDLLSAFDRKISLQRHTDLWKKLEQWIKKSYEVKDAEEFIRRCFEIGIGRRNSAKMILLLYDAYGLEISDKIIGLLNYNLATFANVHNRPYCNVEVQEFYISLICDIINESSNDYRLLKSFDPFLIDIILYLEIQLNSLYHLGNYELCQNLLMYLNTILNCDMKNLVLLKHVSNWFEKILDNIKHSFETVPLQKFIQITVLNMLISYNSCYINDTQIGIVECYLKNELNSPLVKTSEDTAMTKDLQTIWGKMNSELLKENWKLLAYLINTLSAGFYINNERFLHLCSEALDIGGSSVVLPVMRALGKLLKLILSEPCLEKIIDNIWSLIMERKKNEEFHQLLFNFVQMMFQPEILKTKDITFRRILLDYSLRLIYENTGCTANLFIKHIQKIEFNSEVKYLFRMVLSYALLHGHVQKKDERLINEVCSCIETSGISPLINPYNTSNEVRARAVQILLTLKRTEESHCQFATDLVDALIKLEEDINKSKTRYFSDSYPHRVKLRLMQALLILEGLLSQEKSEALLKWVTNKIITENNQQSVRYLQEWLILRILFHYPCFLSEIWYLFDKGLDNRPGSLCSFIAVVYHCVKFIPSGEVASWIDTAVETFLPYSMAQHFSIRLYSQVTLQKLLDLAEKNEIVSVSQKYNVIWKSLCKSIESGNAIRNSNKLQEDFYFTVFNPLEHYSLETIFSDFPRLTNVSPDEWIPNEIMKKCGCDDKRFSIHLESDNESLRTCKSERWILDTSKRDNYIETTENKDGSDLINFQKKIIPIKYLVPDVEELLQSVSYSKRKGKKDGLVVVASLIDRVPNLGGLSRTCEIFGASELVIASLKYVEDKEFQGLSVTAEKWISITEVKPYHLTDYLMKMKENGYTIFAAEQTTNSQSLQSVKFPKKSVLVLGNEKEGIPPVLLPVMDICVEIPQIGIIRSLNVHVSGALFIWEYTKQHCFSEE